MWMKEELFNVMSSMKHVPTLKASKTLWHVIILLSSIELFIKRYVMCIVNWKAMEQEIHGFGSKQKNREQCLLAMASNLLA
jgi:hypothetical protein